MKLLDDQICLIIYLMNKSSSFYSQSYYQKARKQAYKKKPVYRQRNKELYDQQHQLQILKYFINSSGRCEMSRYYQMIAEQFFIMREKNIKGSDEYNQTSKEYLAKVNQKIKYFHQHLMCNQYLTPQEYRREKERTAKEQSYDIKINQIQLDNEDHQFLQGNHKIQREEAKQKQQDCPRRLDTCNQCPIFIQEYEVNFQKTTAVIAKQSSYWDKLNGNQKLAKFRRLIEQNLKILKYELQTKCEFVRQARRPAKSQGFQIDYQYI